MMSAAVSTSRANSRPIKDKISKTALQPQTKSDGPPTKVQPTAEQIRLAQIIGTDDKEFDETIRQLMDMTKKSEEECALALYDCKNDPDKAVMMLLEGDGDQGEWKEQGKKRKRISGSVPTGKSEVITNHTAEHTDVREEQSHERDGTDKQDRNDLPPRRGRRNGGPPPRLARGRGKERNFHGERNDDVEKENGFGTFGGRERSDRGRSRGRGGQSGRRGGRGRNFRTAQRFDKGPQIDTWTNETAENAEKEIPGWGEKWVTEDWSEDTWTGSLTESKVFTSSSIKTEQENDTVNSSSPMNDTASTIGQRLDLGSLLPKTATDSAVESSYISQYNQQATETIKNTIGIGSGPRSNFSNLQTSSQVSANSLASITQQSPQTSQITSSQVIAQNQVVQSSLQQQQRPKPQRSKLPPPSKIPASAVEMPGHLMPQLDVQFGVEFGTDSSPFSFGSGDTLVPSSSYTSGTSSSTTASINNHLGQVSKPGDPVISSAIMASSSAGTKPSSSIAGLDQSSHSAVFQNSTYSSPKKDGQPSLNQSSKISAPEPIPFPPSQTEQKSNSLISSQRSGQSGVPLSQGSLSSSKADTSSLGSFVQSSGYQSSGYQGHKSAGLVSSQAYTHTTNSQAGSFQNQYQTSQKQYPSGQNQYQSGQTQYQSGQSQYQSGQSQYPSYQAGVSFQAQSSYPTSQSSQGSLYQSSTQSSSYQSQTGSYHVRDSQAGSSQPGTSSFQAQSTGLSSPTSQSQTSYGSQSYSSSSHQSNLQTSPMATNKLGDSLSKMSLKETGLDSHQASQYDHSATTTTTSCLTTTTTSGSVSSGTTSVAATSTVVTSSSTRSSTLPSNTKAPPNLPPGVPLLNAHQYIMGQGTIPPFYSLQQPLYPGYDDMQLLQQRLPLASNYYDMSGFPVPSTIAGRDQATLASVPYSASTDSKLNRVEAQSPNPTSQQQSTHSAHQPLINLHYGYYYPSMLPGAAAGFQYPTMFPMPPVTNTAHAGTTASTQFQKNYASHGYTAGKGYDDMTPGQDFTKAGYGASQTQTKGSVGSGSTADIATTAYGKTHPQGFEKQGFHGGTPPPFNLPLATASQAGAMGAPTNPYGFVPMMAHQPHSQMLHHPIQQDSTPGSNRGSQQANNPGKPGGSKGYSTYWGN